MDVISFIDIKNIRHRIINIGDFVHKSTGNLIIFIKHLNDILERNRKLLRNKYRSIVLIILKKGKST